MVYLLPSRPKPVQSQQNFPDFEQVLACWVGSWHDKYCKSFFIGWSTSKQTWSMYFTYYNAHSSVCTLKHIVQNYTTASAGSSITRNIAWLTLIWVKQRTFRLRRKLYNNKLLQEFKLSLVRWEHPAILDTSTVLSWIFYFFRGYKDRIKALHYLNVVKKLPPENVKF